MLALVLCVSCSFGILGINRVCIVSMSEWFLALRVLLLAALILVFDCD